MSESTAAAEMLHTTTGDFPLQEARLAIAGREISILHTNALFSSESEADFLLIYKHVIPYGVALWPSAIAMAEEIAARGDAFRGASVLELGAGTGLPAIVAATLGARVVQTDSHEVAMSVCRRNGARNGVADAIEYRLADWAQWDDSARYDFIVGSDILYGDGTHPLLRAIFERNLAPGGRILLSDPYRAMSFKLLEALEADGWAISLSKWSIGEGKELRRIGLFELRPPRG
jgi:predicted nicotinamide N-methyase